VGPSFRTFVVVGRPGTYGWSKRLRPGTRCIIARWEGGDFISEGEVDAYLDLFVRAGKVTGAQRVEFREAIRKFDACKGETADVLSIRAFARILGMRVITRASETPLRHVEPGEYSMTYWEAYGLARRIRMYAPEVDVRVAKSAEEGRFPFGGNGPKSRPGAYLVRTGPAKARPRRGRASGLGGQSLCSVHGQQDQRTTKGRVRPWEGFRRGTFWLQDLLEARTPEARRRDTPGENVRSQDNNGDHQGKAHLRWELRNSSAPTRGGRTRCR